MIETGAENLVREHKESHLRRLSCCSRHVPCDVHFVLLCEQVQCFPSIYLRQGATGLWHLCGTGERDRYSIDRWQTLVSNLYYFDTSTRTKDVHRWTSQRVENRQTRSLYTTITLRLVESGKLYTVALVTWFTVTIITEGVSAYATSYFLVSLKLTLSL